MDISLIIGWIAGFALVAFGIMQGEKGILELWNFWDPTSVIVVFGGTISALVASFPFAVLSEVPKHLMIALGKQKHSAEEVIHQLGEMAKTARKHGLLVLEEQANELRDPFLKQSIMLIVDAVDADKVRELLENEISATAERHDLRVSIYEKGSAVAPAFGMIGTLIGLINMLRNMKLSGGDNTALGENMSVALVTTFYGCMLAHLLFSPMAKKLRIRSDEELLYKSIIVEGVLSIQAGDNPKFLEEKLMAYLSVRRQNKGMSSAGGEKGSKGGKRKRGK